MMVASSVDGTSRIAWFTRISPSIGIVLSLPGTASVPRKRHNALSFKHLDDFALPQDWTVMTGLLSVHPRFIHHAQIGRKVWPADGGLAPNSNARCEAGIGNRDDSGPYACGCGSRPPVSGRGRGLPAGGTAEPRGVAGSMMDSRD